MFEKMVRTQTAKQERTLEEWLRRHDSENPFPADVSLTKNIDYLGDGKACHRMDLYRPANCAQPLPVLINIHGGGFLLGKKEVNRLFCAQMCGFGFLVCCLEYPLVPDVDIFQVFQDLTVGINHVASVAAQYGGDPERLYLCGDSAGAYLCTYLAAMQNNLSMAQAAHVAQIKPQIKALGLISGMFYICKHDKIGFFLPDSVYGRGWRKHVFFPYTNPENPVLAGCLPPCFLVTAKGDFLRHYSRSFAKVLQKNGIETRLLDVDAGKKLPHAFSAMLPETQEAQNANRDMAAFLLSHS